MLLPLLNALLGLLDREIASVGHIDPRLVLHANDIGLLGRVKHTGDALVFLSLFGTVECLGDVLNFLIRCANKTRIVFVRRIVRWLGFWLGFVALLARRLLRGGKYVLLPTGRCFVCCALAASQNKVAALLVCLGFALGLGSFTRAPGVRFFFGFDVFWGGRRQQVFFKQRRAGWLNNCRCWRRYTTGSSNLGDQIRTR